jgi:hypothetical protein
MPHHQTAARAAFPAAALLGLLAACQPGETPTESPAAAFDVSAADVVVSTTADDGPGSLRQAIADVPDGGTIGFDPALAGQKIALATIEHTTISGNHAIEAGAAADGFGGGIQVGNGGVLTLVNSTVSGNVADQRGGGIAFPGSQFDPTSITLIHSSVIGNSADDFGGGIYIADDDVPLTLQNSIVAGNSATTGPDCDLETGPAVFNGERRKQPIPAREADAMVVRLYRAWGKRAPS